MNQLPRLYLSLLFFINTYFCAQAQIQVNDATVAPFTPENLISNYFLGEGVQVTGVTYEGAAEAVGYFSNAKNAIGLDRGISLTTGRCVSTKIGTTNIFGIDAVGDKRASYDNKSAVSDPDIDNIVKTTSTTPNTKSFNLAKYTIKFIPSADTLRFRYVFASEEYPEYVCAAYNDIFGFFISGPGITGPFENNGINIALIPGTNKFVSINNINKGNGTCPPQFTQYYNDNDKSQNEPVYDAFLDVFAAQVVVQPCKEYTIKLIVADVGDYQYDSGVFLEAKSFGTGSVRVDRVTAAGDNSIIEGCKKGSVVFRLPQKAEKDRPLKCNILGSAVNGVDYKLIQTNFFIPKGDSSLTVNIEAIEDNLGEGTETIGFDIQRDICNRDTFWLTIKDNDFRKLPRKLLKDTLICGGKEVGLDATVNFPIPPNPFFKNTDSLTISTVYPGINDKPGVFPILVSNVAPLEFTPSMLQSVCVNLRHQWSDDIDMYLLAPNGQFIALSTDNGGGDPNYTQTCFTPTASDNIRSGAAPFTGNWKPEESFDDLLGTSNPVNGYWKLIVGDDTPSFEGKFLDWSITFKSNYKIDYSWTPATNISCTDCPQPKVSPKGTTDYIVKVEDIYGCPIRDTASVTIVDSLLAPQTFCSLVTHNTMTLGWIPTPGATGYEVSVNGGAWQNVGTNTAFPINSVTPGTTYSFAVRGISASCGARASAKVCSTLPCTTITPSIDYLTKNTCNGKKDASIRLYANGGTPPYKFVVDTKTNNTGEFDQLSAGLYKVSISDVNGCPAKMDVVITEPAKLTYSLLADSISCVGAEDGYVQLDVKGGQTPYKYQWNNGETQPIIKNLKKNTYKVTVTDDLGCSFTDSIKVYEPTPLILKVTISDVACNGKSPGTATAFLESGGTPPYDYLWSTNVGLQPTAKVIGLTSGIYTVTVSDTKGCKISQVVSIGESPELKISSTSANPKCFGDKTGDIEAKITGSYPPYTYLWSNGATTPKIENLVGGTYYLSVTDGYKCIFRDTFEIKQPDSIAVTGIVVNNDCFGQKNGSISLDVKGSVGNYSYTWSNGAPSGTKIDNLKAGNYSVDIKDALGCVQKYSTDITQPDSILILTNVKNTTCSGGAAGEISIQVTGGAQPYGYNWVSNNGFTSSQQNLTTLKSGTYNLTLSDAKGCTSLASAKIDDPVSFSVSENIKKPKCYGASDGAIDLTLSTNAATLKFKWNTGDTTQNIANIKGGIYEVTVADANGCSTSKTYNVAQPDSISIMVTTSDTLCFQKLGEISAEAKGGTAPYQYNWNNGVNQDKNTNVSPGLYTISVTDVNGCESMRSVNLYAFDEIKLVLTQQDISCNNLENGGVEVSQVRLGANTVSAADFAYRWSNNATTAKIENLKPGTYTVTVSNTKGCSATESKTLTNPAPINIVLKEKNNPSCAVGNDGSIEVAVNGGLAPFDFVWSNGSNTSIITGLDKGSFDVTVTDVNGCKSNSSFTLQKATAFTMQTASRAEKCTTGTGFASVETIGGTAPFRYNWSNTANSKSINNIAAGTYTVTVSDAVGCVQVATVKVDSAKAVRIDIVTTNLSCGGQANGNVVIVPKSGTPPFVYSFDSQNFSSQSRYIALRAGTYEILVKDAENCTAAGVANLIEPEPMSIVLGKDTTINYGEAYRIPTIVNNANGNVIFTWIPDDIKLTSCGNCQNPIVTPKTSTLYSVIAKDSLGCKASAAINVRLRITTTSLVPTAFSPNGDEQNDILRIHGDEGAEVLEFRIYDRWGAILYEAKNFAVNDDKTGWDGYHRGSASPSGTYVWSLRAKFKDGSIKNSTGQVMLIK